MLSLEGQQLGNYDIIRRIRVGGMGAVYEGRQRTAFGRRVAIKVILGDYASDKDMRRRFAREARTIARLHHPHILPLIEFGDERGILYLVMPFIEGGTLTSYLRRTLPGLDEVAAIYQQLLDAVEYAHDEGLIHRDIKSSNVLFEERRNGPPYIYLADFGLVRTTRQAENSQIGKPIPLDQVPGTPHYMAPEQTRGIVTPLTDIYALGVLLYQMLTGELPYNDPDEVRVIQMHLQASIPLPSLHDASIPREVDEVVRLAMAKRPEARYRTVAELRQAFLAALKSKDVASELESVSQAREEFIDEIEIEDAEDIFTAPPVVPRRHIPEPLEMPEPMNEGAARTDDGSVPVAVRESQIRDTRGRQRITEEPLPGTTVRLRRSGKARAGLVVAIIVPLILIGLLLMPHVLGFSFFPSGFPLLGTPPIATVYITLQNRSIRDTYLLTASPQVKQADLVAHTIPDRILQQNASASSTAQVGGAKNIAGAQAHGTLNFINAGDKAITLPISLILTTPSGVRIQLRQGAEVPPNGGRVNVPAVAVDPGVAGNIPAHSIDGPCCNDSLMVRNQAAFNGGVDAQTIHIVSQADLDNAQNTQAARLEQGIEQQFQSMLQPGEVLASQPTYKVTTTSDKHVGDQAEQVKVNVSVSGSAVAYNRAQAVQTASQLLRAQAIQTLDSNYQQQGDLVTSQPTVQPGKDGVIYVSITVSGVWAYNLSPQITGQWRQSIRGATSAAALAYLNSRPGIASVQINLPFGTDHLPDTIDNIQVVAVGK